MTRLDADFDGIGDMLRSPEIGAMLMDVLAPVHAEALALAADHVDTGEYIGSFRTRLVEEPTTYGRTGNIPRAIAKLENTSPDAIFVEYGNGTPGTRYHIMLRALDAAKL